MDESAKKVANMRRKLQALVASSTTLFSVTCPVVRLLLLIRGPFPFRAVACRVFICEDMPTKTFNMPNSCSPFLTELLQGGTRLPLKWAAGSRHIERMVGHGFC